MLSTDTCIDAHLTVPGIDFGLDIGLVLGPTSVGTAIGVAGEINVLRAFGSGDF